MTTMLPAETTSDTGTDATADRLRLSVTRLHRLLRQHSAGDLTLTQSSALASVNKHGPLTLGDLAAAEQVSPPTITNVVGKLERAGYVERTIDTHDRRVCRVSITPAGQDHLLAIRESRTAWLATRLAELEPDDLARLTDVLDLLEHLSAEPTTT